MADELPTPEPRAVLESIYEQNRKFYSDRRGIGALRDLQQTFPNPWLYIAELLQNAVDEGAARITVNIRERGSVVFEHDGDAFSLQDVEALCTKGVSAKGANTVGFMGIGFKSVFRSFESVQISSGPWLFALTVAIRQGQEYGDQQRDWLGAVLPRWDPSASPPSPGMKCRFVLLNRLPDLPPPAEDLERVLGKSETLLALLAWQGVKELNWNGKSWLLERRESALNHDGDLRVLLESLDGEGNSCRRWILFSKTYQPSRPAIARFLEHRQLSPPPEERDKIYQEASQRRKVAVFCETDESDNPIPADRGSAFALLPTGVTFPLGLHVQADWLLVVTRREIMQIEGNQWHEEILEQLPRLIRYYLEWLVAHHNQPAAGWNRGYEALPSRPSQNVVSDEWFEGRKFIDGLTRELQDLAFLPKPPDRNGTVTFLTPESARFLPQPFAKEFENAESHPNLLFGDHIIVSHLFGGRARECLERLQLLQELAADDLVAHWDDDVLKRWVALFPENTRHRMILRIMKALSELDDRNEWQHAALVCLPTASGNWAHRRAISRHPADWNILAQEDDIRRALEPFLGPPERLLSWDFDSILHQTRYPAVSYLDSVLVPRLDDVVGQWWESMPKSPSAEDVRLVVRFSTWILEKQPQRKRLIQKLLSLDQLADLRLCSNDETLLTEPYAGAHRRLFFPANPAIAPVYESQSSTVSRADWRAFFEKLDPPPAGRFSLNLAPQFMSQYALTKFIGGHYSPPACRARAKSVEWNGLTVVSGGYTVVDASLPPTLSKLLHGTVTRDQFFAIALWLGESPASLCDYGSVLIAYIPQGASWAESEHLPRKAKWIVTLSNASWVYTESGGGPFRASDVLSSKDPARPNAPVADLPAELAEALGRCGLEFGSALPDAPAIDRLRIQGPSAPADQLVEFLQSAITEAGDDESKKDFLARVLLTQELFSLPPGRVSIDGKNRVSHRRIIWNDRDRSVLGNWLISIASFDEGAPERKVLEVADSFLPVPKTTTFVQVLDFLSWVWTSQPDADEVRRLLPRAYGYVKEDLTTDINLNALWKEAVQNAHVFVQGRRRWTPVRGADLLFFDDLNDGALRELLPSIDLVTPGHFGDTPLDQVAVANLLAITLLSSRFSVAVEPKGPHTIPEHWHQGFTAIQNWLRGQLTNEDGVELGAGTKGVPLQNFRLSRWQTLRTVVYDSGTPVRINLVRAAPWKDGSIAVSSMPDEFGEELCRVLFNQWGLRLRRDLVELIPRVAIQLTRIDNPNIVAEWVSGKTPGHMDQSSSFSDQERPTQPLATDKNVPIDDHHLTSVAAGESAPSVPTADETPSEVARPEEVPPGGSYTAESREARIRALILNKHDLERKIREALTTDVLPDEKPEEESVKTGEFPTDDPYRHAALKYEMDNHRYAVAKTATQSGHDIDSYTHPEGHPERKLIRRIEIKGRSMRWDFNEIVEMSDTQFKDALNMRAPDGETLHSDFDYWLYVVEMQENGELKVLPIRNVARRVARFGLKGGSWRYEAEPTD